MGKSKTFTVETLSQFATEQLAQMRRGPGILLWGLQNAITAQISGPKRCLAVALSPARRAESRHCETL
jgi:hypothetical protein